MLKIVSLIIFTVLSCKFQYATAQDTLNTRYKISKLRFNNVGLTPYPALSRNSELSKFNTLGLSYERRILPKISLLLAVIGGYESKSSVMVINNINATGNMPPYSYLPYKYNKTTFGFRPEIRYYLKEDTARKPFNNGFYLGANFGFNYSRTDYKPSINPNTNVFYYDNNTIYIGPNLGFQKVFKFGFLFDIGGSLVYTRTGSKANTDPNKRVFNTLPLEDSYYFYFRVGYAF